MSSDASEADVQRVRQELGLDDPLYAQYVRFVGGAVRGDFGRSFRTRQPVTAEIGSRLPATVQLALASLVVSVVLGVASGVVSGARQYSLLDHATMVGTLLGVSVPGFWLGLMLMSSSASSCTGCRRPATEPGRRSSSRPCR